MKVRAAAEIVYCCYRIILQENEILFPCNRRLEEAVSGAPDKPEHIIELSNGFIKHMNDETADKLVHTLKEWMKI